MADIGKDALGGQNFAAWRIRCEFDKDGLIPAGYSHNPIDLKAPCEPRAR
jgi:hypothetical protein